jgi:hypothetical protein
VLYTAIIATWPWVEEEETGAIIGCYFITNRPMDGRLKRTDRESQTPSNRRTESHGSRAFQGIAGLPNSGKDRITRGSHAKRESGFFLENVKPSNPEEGFEHEQQE